MNVLDGNLESIERSRLWKEWFSVSITFAWWRTRREYEYEFARGCTHFSLGKRGEKQNKKRTSGIWISFMKRTPKFSKTIPSEAAKNANTCEMKCFSSAVSFSQCFMSSCKSTSSDEIGERKREFQGKKKKVNFWNVQSESKEEEELKKNRDKNEREEEVKRTSGPERRLRFLVL